MISATIATSFIIFFIIITWWWDDLLEDIFSVDMSIEMSFVASIHVLLLSSS